MAVSLYDAEAERLAARFEALRPQEIYAGVLSLFPQTPAQVIDIGAGTGRDASWLAGQGHAVTAVEPSAGLRLRGQRLHGDADIVWIDAVLPALAGVTLPLADFVLISGVWQHVQPPDRLGAIARVAGLVAPGGRLLLSFRHGPTDVARHIFPCDPDEAIGPAEAHGLTLAARREMGSQQPHNRALGVHWTWLALDRA